MSEQNLFEVASRTKLRFATTQGALTVEDLWDLPLQSNSGRANLDDIAKQLHSQLKATSEIVSFVNPSASSENESLQRGFDIVKRVIEVRVAERDAAAAAVKKKEQKNRILEIIAKKEDEKLSNSSVEELRAMLAEV